MTNRTTLPERRPEPAESGAKQPDAPDRRASDTPAALFNSRNAVRNSLMAALTALGMAAAPAVHAEEHGPKADEHHKHHQIKAGAIMQVGGEKPTFGGETTYSYTPHPESKYPHLTFTPAHLSFGNSYLAKEGKEHSFTGVPKLFFGSLVGLAQNAGPFEFEAEVGAGFSYFALPKSIEGVDLKPVFPLVPTAIADFQVNLNLPHHSRVYFSYSPEFMCSPHAVTEEGHVEKKCHVGHFVGLGAGYEF